MTPSAGCEECGHSFTSHAPRCPCGCSWVQPYARPVTPREVEDAVLDFLREKVCVLEYCANLPRPAAEAEARRQAADLRRRLERPIARVR